ncbi:MAG: FimB/Mfa2 family fimbrial subunit [Bacteroidales bacterium]|nr:FimB/Mfa2 family fimbrial subunit [Bacteroidales bacterium]
MKRLRLSFIVLSGLFVIMLHTGCSIKEDRGACPCALILDFSGVDRYRSDSLSLGITSTDGFLYQDVVRSTSYGRPYRVNVPKGGEVWVNAYSVDTDRETLYGELSSDRSSLTIPYGEECPEVSSFSLHTSLLDETLTVPVILHKNYCRLTITMETVNGTMPLQVAILGEICGYDRDGQPAEGEFRYEPAGSGGIFYAKIPRQTDTSLRLDIADSEETLREFAIGEYIIESGYDWEAEDLNDVEILIDFASSYVTVNVNGWTETIEIEAVI